MEQFETLSENSEPAEAPPQPIELAFAWASGAKATAAAQKAGIGRVPVICRRLRSMPASRQANFQTQTQTQTLTIGTICVKTSRAQRKVHMRNVMCLVPEVV